MSIPKCAEAIIRLSVMAIDLGMVITSHAACLFILVILTQFMVKDIVILTIWTDDRDRFRTNTMMTTRTLVYHPSILSPLVYRLGMSVIAEIPYLMDHQPPCHIKFVMMSADLRMVNQTVKHQRVSLLHSIRRAHHKVHVRLL